MIRAAPLGCSCGRASVGTGLVGARAVSHKRDTPPRIPYYFGGRVGSAHAASTFVQRGKGLFHKSPFLFYPHSPFACDTCGVCGRGTSTFSLRSKCIRVWEPRFSKTPCRGTMHVSSHTVSPATLCCFCLLVVYFCNPSRSRFRCA
jgi:hypothetical protein